MPRKGEQFQSDLYPDTFAGRPSLKASEWFVGEAERGWGTWMEFSLGMRSRVEFRLRYVGQGACPPSSDSCCSAVAYGPCCRDLLC